MSAALRWPAVLGGLLVCGAALGSRTRPPGVAPDSLTMRYEVSGLPVIQRINRANDVVAVSLYLLGGTRQLSKRTAGIEALLLRASGRGTERYPGRQVRRVMARTGSVEVLEPDADWTVFGFVGLRQELDSSWSVFADRVMHPTLAPDGVDLARAALVAAARRRYSDPDERIRIIADMATFAGHPYALDPSGTVQSLTALTPADLADYARTQMETSRMLLVVVGNVERAQVESLVTATLGRLPRGDYVWTLPPPVQQPGRSHWLIESRVLPTNYILAYFVGPPASSDHDYAAFHVATDVLSSLLFQRIRIEKGLSYAAYAPFEERAIAVGGVYASSARPEAVLPLMVEQVRLLVSQQMDPGSLHRFIDTYVLTYLQQSETNAAQADLLARADLYLGDYRRADAFLRQLRGVRSGDVLDVAQRYMVTPQWAYLGDTVRMRGKW